MTRFLLNSPILTDYGLWEYRGPIPAATAREWAREGFTSAVGHPATAELLSDLLGQPVPVRRARARLAPGDEALVFRLLERLGEGAVLDSAGLGERPWELGLLKRLA